MQYRTVPKNGDILSALGYGTMRLPLRTTESRQSPDPEQVDEARAIRQIRSAIESGVNYLDTGYLYRNGESEVVLGKALAEGYRDRVKIADKLPPTLVTSREDMDRFLEVQLRRLGSDSIDYYMLLYLDPALWTKMTDLGVFEFLETARKAGKIKNIGFSFHGDIGTFREIVDCYDWTFCQIQYNILDEENQAGTEGLRYAASKNIAVMIMEPLRGGMLAENLPKPVRAIYDNAETSRSPAAWALRWVWDHPEVTVVLSGMNDEHHIRENIQICEEALPEILSDTERATIDEAAQSFKKLIKVNCTQCGYCLPCPQGVDIPACFSFYNQYHMHDDKAATRELYIARLIESEDTPSSASLCQNCGICLSGCPQGIDIPAELKKVARDLEGLPQ